MTDLAGTVTATPRRVSSRFGRLALLAAGALLTAIGVIGIFVPLLPTTIFLLLAAACFGRSSPGAHRWLTTNRWFGSYLHNYQVRRGATVWTKAVSIGTLWLGIGGAIYLLSPAIWVTAGLLVIAVAVSVHLLSLKTLRD